jgi:hypothetical protein
MADLALARRHGWPLKAAETWIQGRGA